MRVACGSLLGPGGCSPVLCSQQMRQNCYGGTLTVLDERGRGVAGNVLQVGVPRLGWFADGDPNTPLTAAMLVDDGTHIHLTIPWSESESPYERWFFGRGVNWADDPDKTKHRYSVPDLLWFWDVRGQVTLVGCRGVEATGPVPGEGRAHVGFAVMGGDGEPDYRKVNGLRSEMPGLSEWMSLRSLTHQVTNDAQGRLKALDLRLESPEPVLFSRAMNLRIRPNFSFNLPATPDTSTIRESLQIETMVKRPRDWFDHLSAHNTVRELVNVAAWLPFGYSAQWASRTDDPERVLDGSVVGVRWSEVRSYLSRRDEPRSSRPRFLYVFDDIGTAGFGRWTRLRSHFARGVNPILSTVEQTRTSIEATLAQSGIGLDAIGYQLALDGRVSKGKAKDETHRDRLCRIAAELTVPPPFDESEWATRSSDAYNGVKHADRDLPDVLTAANTLRENQLIFRLWVAGRIGVPVATLKRNVERDPMTRPYVYE
jgi:hypothetical protein